MTAHLPSLGMFDHTQVEVPAMEAEVQRLRDTLERLLPIHRQLMELLHADRPEQMVHHLRNVLNERDLYKVVANLVHASPPADARH